MTTATKVSPKNHQPRLKMRYQQGIIKELRAELKLTNAHEVPKLEKVMVNVGLGKAQDEKKLLEAAANTLLKITGQRPVPTLAKKSIASFKLRQGSQIGLKVTLRGDRMYEFVDRFINLVLPRLRDFRGVSLQAFDRDGNYSIGLTDQSSFPELSYEDTAVAHGLQITFAVRAKQPEQSKALLMKFGLPFEKVIKESKNG